MMFTISGLFMDWNRLGYVEFWNRFDVPSNKIEDDRSTLQLFVAFYTPNIVWQEENLVLDGLFTG